MKKTLIILGLIAVTLPVMARNGHLIIHSSGMAMSTELRVLERDRRLLDDRLIGAGMSYAATTSGTDIDLTILGTHPELDVICGMDDDLVVDIDEVTVDGATHLCE